MTKAGPVYGSFATVAGMFDHPDLDHRQISAGLQLICTAYPTAAGIAAHQTDVSLAAGDADGRPANDVKPPAEVLSWRQDSERHPLSAS